MNPPTRVINMRLSPEIEKWLEEKAGIGYRKTAVINMILAEYMRLEKREEWPRAAGGADGKA